MKIVINGGGKVGSFLAADMVKNGHQVTLIERRSEVAEKVVQEVPEALVILGDGCDVRFQEDADISRADVFVSVTGDDDDNLVACQIAKNVFGAPRTIARVNNPKNEQIFHSLGIEAVSSTTIISKLIEEEVSVGDIVTLQTLKKGKLALIEFDLPQENCPIVGKLVKDIKLPADCVLVAILRDDEVLIPRGDSLIKTGDSIIALASREKERLLKKSLLGR